MPTPRTLIVDGTRDVIADGRAVTMHAICNKTDYTHQRVVGFAHSLEDAHVFAAAFDMRDALASLVLSFDDNRALSNRDGWENARAALTKSEARK